MLRVDAEPQGHLDGFVELRVLDLLNERNRLFERIRAIGDLGLSGLELLPHWNPPVVLAGARAPPPMTTPRPRLRAGPPTNQPTTSSPIELAVPATLRMAAS